MMTTGEYQGLVNRSHVAVIYEFMNRSTCGTSRTSRLSIDCLMKAWGSIYLCTCHRIDDHPCHDYRTRINAVYAPTYAHTTINSFAKSDLLANNVKVHTYTHNQILSHHLRTSAFGPFRP